MIHQNSYLKKDTSLHRCGRTEERILPRGSITTANNSWAETVSKKVSTTGSRFVLGAPCGSYDPKEEQYSER